MIHQLDELCGECPTQHLYVHCTPSGYDPEWCTVPLETNAPMVLQYDKTGVL